MAKVAVQPEVAVAIASLVKMIGLLGAELVVGTHHDDIDIFEAKVREKLHASIGGIPAGSTAAGVALAHSLLEPVLRDLRARAQVRAAEVSHAISCQTVH